MGLFDDFSRFLETRLDEFLRAHPELELQAIEDQLREQEADSQRLIVELQAKQKRLEAQILETAQDIQRWHVRIAKVEAAGDLKLGQAAREREAALLRQGNQLWGQRESVQTRLSQAETLLAQVRSRLAEVKSQIRQEAEARAARSTNVPGDQTNPGANTGPDTGSETSGWAKGWHSSGGSDPLEDQFRRWELDEELAALKRKMG